MRFAAIADEVTRGARSGTTRTGSFALVCGALLTLLAVADAVLTTSLIDEAHRFRDSGAATLVIIAPGAVNGEACDALSRLPGVQAAGATRAAQHSVVASVLPRAPLDHYEVSEGFGAVVGVTGTLSSGIALSDDVASILGLAGDGDPLPTDSGTAQVVGRFSYPADGRRPGYGWAAITTADTTGHFDECWVTAWPSSDAVRSVALTAVAAAATSDTRVQTTQLNPRHGEAFDGQRRYRERVSATVPVVAVAVTSGLAWLAVRMRRLEFAARLHDGASRGAVALLAVCEVVLWLVPSALIAVSAAAVVAWREAGSEALPVVVNAALAAVAAVLAGVAGSVAAVTHVRERHLFVYFADR